MRLEYEEIIILASLNLLRLKLYYILIISTFLTLSGFAQVKRVYINSKGALVDNPSRAVSYALIQKISDSAYAVEKFDMHDTIIMKGAFKDELMTIPSGKFIYYEKRKIREELKVQLRTNTNNFINCIGYFNNGLKTGLWTEYEKPHVKSFSYTYQNGKMNGLFQRFDSELNDYVLDEGYYIDGKKEGEWNRYGYDTLKTPISTTIFKNDKIVKVINHIEMAKLPEKIEDYLIKYLLPKIDTTNDRVIDLEVTIDIDGSVKNPVVLNDKSLAFNAMMNEVFTSFPKFTAEEHDNKPIKMNYFLTISFKDLYVDWYRYGVFDIQLSRLLGNGLDFRSFYFPTVHTIFLDHRKYR